MTAENHTIGGIVLCGGESRRMGTAKAWLKFGDETLLQRIVRVLGEVVDPIVVVAAVGQELPVLPGNVLLVRDAEPGRGPLQGLHDGLSALAGRAEAAFVTSCDAPLLRPAFVFRMIDLLNADREAGICVPRADGHFHPLAAVYRVTVLPAVQQLLAEDQRQMMLLFDKLPTRIVTPAVLADVDPALLSLRNLNTPEDYQAALQEAAGNPGPTM